MTYTAGANGVITGTSPQAVVAGGSGTPVLAVANTGYLFAKWSDARTDNPRTDININGNVSVTAIYVEIGMKTPGINKFAYNENAGYAWSENAGWINFAAAQSTAAIEMQTGTLSGYAWGENIGWVKFSGSAYRVQFAL